MIVYRPHHQYSFYVTHVIGARNSSCPQCNANNNELTSFPIMSNESFTFDHNDKLGTELEFMHRRKDNNN